MLEWTWTDWNPGPLVAKIIETQTRFTDGKQVNLYGMPKYFPFDIVEDRLGEFFEILSMTQVGVRSPSGQALYEVIALRLSPNKS